jgi:hypothetical protein
MSKRATAFCAVAVVAITACAASADVVVRAKVTRTRLSIAAGALQSPTELVLRNIRYDAHPGTQFHVILERRDDRARRARVGTLSFYAPAKGTTSRTFDVTDELRQIAATKADLAKIDVVFEATTGRGDANAKPTFDAGSKLTIGAVELRVKK